MPEPASSFEQSLARIETIVRELEDGQVGLGESLARYEEGIKLFRQCYQLLEQAQRKIELLTGVDAEGNPVTQPLEDGELSLEEKAENRGRRRVKSSRKPASDTDSDESVDEPGSLF